MSTKPHDTERIDQQLAEIDSMPGPLRACVHEYGYAIVKACIAFGVKKPNHIRQLVHEIWKGARQPAQKHQRDEAGGKVLKQLDWALIQAGSPITAKALLRILLQHGLFVVPREPSDYAIQASMDAIKELGLLSKPEKHRLRLRAANLLMAKRAWPHLFGEPMP